MGRKTTIAWALTCSLLLVAEAAPIAADFFKPTILFLCTVYVALIQISGAIAFLVIIWAGIKYIGAYDDPGERKYAKEMIKHVFIGLLIIILAGAVIDMILSRRLDTSSCTVLKT